MKFICCFLQKMIDFCIEVNSRGASARQLYENFCRIQAKAFLLAEKARILRTYAPDGGVAVSELDHAGNPESRVHLCEQRLERIEQKLDQLLAIQANAQSTPPAWFEGSARRLLHEITAVGEQVDVLSNGHQTLVTDNKILRREISELADGADRFLAGLQGGLSSRDVELFWELIFSETNEYGQRRCRSYAEIGKRLNGVSKQAIESRVRKLKKHHPRVWGYISAIRTPKQAVPYSGLSPSERRKEGIDEAYNYDAD
jgi:hypothetical protein